MYINNNWLDFFDNELHKEYFLKLNDFVDSEYKSQIVFPEYKNIFRAFNLLTPSEVKVVIIGQDPYHGAKQANGLAFSVASNCKIPPSLKNIYKELCNDIGCGQPANGDLTQWAKQGVLLINSVFTVRQAAANSHKNKGWELFTDSIISKLSKSQENIVFILWGAPSQKKAFLIDEHKHLVLKAPHPSPLSSYRGFFGSKPFSQTNRYLKEHHRTEIDWALSAQETLL